MQIAQVVVGNAIYPLIEGQPLPIAIGDTLKVFYAFRYRIPEEADIKIWASLYKYSFGIIDRQGQSQTKGTIILPRALDWENFSGEIDIVIGNMSAGTYGLILELPDYDVEERIDDSLEVATVAGIFDMIGPILIIGIMAMVLPMLTPKKGG